MASPTQEAIQRMSERLDRGDQRFAHIEDTQKAIMKSLEQIERAVERLQADVADTKEIVEVANAAKTVGKFAKWLTGVLVAMTGAYAVLRLGVLHMIGK